MISVGCLVEGRPDSAIGTFPVLWAGLTLSTPAANRNTPTRGSATLIDRGSEKAEIDFHGTGDAKKHADDDVIFESIVSDRNEIERTWPRKPKRIC